MFKYLPSYSEKWPGVTWSLRQLQASEWEMRPPSDSQMRPGHETRGLSRVSRIMSRVTIKWQDCSCCVTVSWLPDRELSNDTLYCNNDKRYLVITPSPDASLDTCLPPALVLKDKFIVATFLRTSLLKISVELCFILPWINWISESCSLSSSRGMIRVLLVDFLWQTPGLMSHCIMIVCGEADRSGLLIS